MTIYKCKNCKRELFSTKDVEVKICNSCKTKLDEVITYLVDNDLTIYKNKKIKLIDITNEEDK